MFIRAFLLFLFLAPAAAPTLVAQERTEPTPELDSLKKELSATLGELEDVLIAARNQPELLRQFGPHLTDDRPFLTEPAFWGTYTFPFNSQVINLLRDNVDFVNLPITDSLRQEAYDDFWNEHGGQVIFSPLTVRFTDEPLMQREIEYRLVEKRIKPAAYGNLDYLKQEFVLQLERGQFNTAVEIMGKVGYCGTPEAFTFLRECSAGQHWPSDSFPKPAEMYVSICKSLAEFPDLEAARLILSIAEEQELGDHPTVLGTLAKITNLEPKYIAEPPADNLAWYRQKLTANTTLPELIRLGFDLVAPFTREEFDDDHDYFANLITGSRDIPHVNYHALLGALALEDPISLAYVGPQLYAQASKFGNHPNRQISYLLEEKTGISVEVRTAEGEWTNHYPDKTSQKDYAAYWLQQANDYSWNEEAGQYLNGVDFIASLDSVSYWFDQLYQPMEEPAVYAFFRLTEQDSTRVDERIGHYEMSWMANDFSPHLSGYSDKIIPALTRLSAWYRAESIDYRRADRNRWLLDLLRTDLSAVERLQREDSIIAVLQPTEIIPLEYWLIINAVDDLNMHHSFSRILDRWYAQYFQSLVEDKQQLRAYLKRAYHYGQFEIEGGRINYATRFRGAGADIVKRLEILRNEEGDVGIRRAAAEALTWAMPQKEPEVSTGESPETAKAVAHFMAIPVPGAQDFNSVLWQEGLTIEQEEKVLDRLVDLEDCSDLAFISLQRARPTRAHFDQFRDCPSTAKELSMLVDIFDHLDSSQLLNLVADFTRTLDTAERGEVYLYLLLFTRFDEWLWAGHPDFTPQDAERCLTAYYASLEGDFAAFHRSQIGRLLEDIRNRDLPLLTRLKMAKADTSEARYFIIQELWRKSDFDDMPGIIAELSDDKTWSPQLATLISRDWDIPLPESAGAEKLENLADDIRSLSREEVYWKYLKPYKLDLKPNGEWNYLRVYDILEFDAAIGFVGSGLRANNDYVFAIIRLLEIEFGTRLSYPRKFHVSFGSRSNEWRARTRAWQDFLVEKGLVVLPDDYVRSVSNVRDR